jgi:two-component system nitrate/nitrite response regulator NarL
MNILIVDDHPHIRLGTGMSLRTIISDASISEADSIASVQKNLLDHVKIDLVLLDLCLGDSVGIDTLRTLRAGLEAAGQLPRIVIVSGNEDPDLIDSVLNEHGTGFIPKGVSGEIFKNAIQLTLAGGVYIPEIYLRSRQPRALPGSGAESTQEKSSRLTDMERLVASYCVQGLTYKQIARAISEQRGKEIADLTVKTHVRNIAIKLGIQGEGKAAVVAQISRLNLKFPINSHA